MCFRTKWMAPGWWMHRGELRCFWTKLYIVCSPFDGGLCPFFSISMGLNIWHWYSYFGWQCYELESNDVIFFSWEKNSAVVSNERQIGIQWFNRIRLYALIDFYSKAQYRRWLRSLRGQAKWLDSDKYNHLHRIPNVRRVLPQHRVCSDASLQRTSWTENFPTIK